MVKPKAQTLQQKLGFFDEDLKKPKHDELMLWLDRNIEKIINEIFNKPFTQNELDAIIEKYKKIFNSLINRFEKRINEFYEKLATSEEERRNILPSLRWDDNELLKYISESEEKVKILKNFTFDSLLVEKPRITKIEKKWEVPINTDFRNKYTIGFIDFSAHFNIPKLYINGLKSNDPYESKIDDFYDFEIEKLGFEIYASPKRIFVEVKTEIPSLGELIRQINHYKSYMMGDYYVLCPENKYKDLLYEQGINFIEYKQYE